MIAAVALQGQTQPKKPQFFMATPEELKQGYKAKIFSAEAYLYCLVKAKRAEGWKWSVKVKEFCAEWEIAESTFYWALSKLRAKNKIFWRPNDNTVVIWWDKEVAEMANAHSSDLPNSPNPDTAIALPDVREPLQDVREQFPDVREPLQDVRERNPQALTVAESHNASYSLQIYPEKNTDFKEEVCVFSEKLLEKDPECGQQNEGLGLAAPISNTEIGQVANRISDEGLGLAAPISNTEIGQVANKISNEGLGFAPPVRKTSQKQEWVCPGTDEEKNQFLIFKGELLVAAKQCKPVEARTAALSWANHKPEAANLLWEDWQREKVQDANRSTAYETVPEFGRMPEQEHAEVLEKFINHTKQEFLNLCWWHEHWLEFACRQFRVGKDLIPGLTPEIIKQIKAY
ncbi:hypothetical protein [Nostoc sphaeroides]|uniref:Uncharacterized protein n=1 Tax=Nostoc sphaeroides CCNUC1 TaxID=2653204 RepID=A0A5P8WJY1_9NOSO|nr:hypothetical protein [Nostoc sphaeroides]QFS52880.1 hypothetical protein GXM_10144 [Nostoc sphaeroides CCNUC1]